MATNITVNIAEYVDAEQNLIFLTPDDRVSTLSLSMNKIRHIPIVESKELRKLICVISKVELRRLKTPPKEQLPVGELILGGLDIEKLYDVVTKTSKQLIKDAFYQEYFKPDTPQVFSLSVDDKFVEVFKALVKRDDLGKRPRTLAILSSTNPRPVKSMYSYTDLLRLIADPKQENDEFLDRDVTSVMTSKVKTFWMMDKVTDAIDMWCCLPFTHFPLRRSEEEKDTQIDGFIDDMVLSTFDHELINPCATEISLSRIAQMCGREGSVGKHNTVTEGDTIRTAISKFINGLERPTSILVGDLFPSRDGQSESCKMKGIVSYVDIFREFAKFVGHEI